MLRPNILGINLKKLQNSE